MYSFALGPIYFKSKMLSLSGQNALLLLQLLIALITRSAVNVCTIFSVFICNLMWIGRWSELSVDRVCHQHEVMKDADANETYGKID